MAGKDYPAFQNKSPIATCDGEYNEHDELQLLDESVLQEPDEQSDTYNAAKHDELKHATMHATVLERPCRQSRG